MSPEKRVELILAGIKTLSVVIGTIVLFLIVQHPDSLLRKDSAEESRSLERAKLALEILKQQDPKIRAESFLVLRAVWGNKDEWIKTIECKAVIEAGYIKFEAEADAKAQQYKKEILGLGDSKLPGMGPKAARLKAELEEVLSNRNSYREQLQFCGFYSSGGGF
jgi:hypothetical protein